MPSQSQVWIFGNPDYKPDALPLKILPELKQRLPDLDFVVKDPNEDWEMPAKLIIIDTIVGIDKVTCFTTLKRFQSAPRLTMHDFDLGTNLMWLNKLKKLPPFLIIGIPVGATKKEIIGRVATILERETVETKAN